MSPIGTPVPGAFPLTDVGKLPNVTVSYPGERWSDAKAASAIDPGTAIVVVGSAGKALVRPVVDGDDPLKVSVATRTIDVPDVNPGSIYSEHLGPNEIRNLPIKIGDYVLRLVSGALILTLVVPDNYQPGDFIGWDTDGARPAGKGTTNAGAWAKQASGIIGPLFEVQSFQVVNSNNEGILRVRSLRGQGPF